MDLKLLPKQMLALHEENNEWHILELYDDAYWYGIPVTDCYNRKDWEENGTVNLFDYVSFEAVPKFMLIRGPLRF